VAAAVPVVATVPTVVAALSGGRGGAVEPHAASSEIAATAPMFRNVT
jgi:hypothetical protein